MLEAAELRPGTRVLEVACGAGRVGLQAADLVAPDGRVVCTDYSKEMIDAVSRLAEKTQRANVDTRVLDALEMELGDERFDVVICRFGYMLMPDPALALRNSRDALNAGGRLVLAVWGTGAENPWLMAIFEAVMARLNAPPPEPGTPGPFALGEPDAVRELLDGAGFAAVEVTSLTGTQQYESPEAWWQEIREVSGPLAALLTSLPEPDRTAIQDSALEKADRYAQADGRLVFPATMVGARAS
jgi:SAM-dependent methyltransferase